MREEVSFKLVFEGTGFALCLTKEGLEVGPLHFVGEWAEVNFKVVSNFCGILVIAFNTNQGFVGG
jgi:hypothetical protein